MSGLNLFGLNLFSNDNIDNVKSQVDNNSYVVRKLPDAQIAADMLAQIRSELIQLVEELSKVDTKYKRAYDKLQYTEFMENTENKYTSYSINKGEKLVFCLRDRRERHKNKIHEHNLVMYVALHELAHIVTPEIGHTKLFWKNFHELLDEAEKRQIFKKINFTNTPKHYCGMFIDN